MKTVLILGGAGFIGFNIAKYLSENRNYKITIADNHSRQGGRQNDLFTKFIKNNDINVVNEDFTDVKSYERIEKNYDYVYMLASVVGVDIVNSNPHEIIRINTALIYNTLEWLRKSDCDKVLFTSTSECYAGSIDSFGCSVPTAEDIPLTISDIKQPRFTYAVTKMLGESGFIQYAKKYKFNCSIVRYHNVYGPCMGFKHVIPHLAQRFYNGETPFNIYGHNQTRAFNFIDDAVDGTVKAMEYGSNGEIYHIGSEEEITIDELTRYTGKIVGYSGEYINAPTYPGSVSRRCPDITKAKSELGYDPKVHWKDGLEKTINWYFTYLKADNPLYESFYDKKLA